MASFAQSLVKDSKECRLEFWLFTELQREPLRCQSRRSLLFLFLLGKRFIPWDHDGWSFCRECASCQGKSE